eukprot:scpid95789/ scgid14161/ Uridine 5&apos; Orotate phosphoribosyltransferase; Orotidine 5&apos; OMPdecase
MASELILALHDIGAIKFGQFTLKSGIQSPVYFDFRDVSCFPKLLRKVSEALWKAGQDAGIRADSVCGVPYTALPFATVIADHHEVPMVIRRKEAKSYGTAKLIEGDRVLTAGSRCLVVEDVVTSGSSVLDTVRVLKEAAEGVIVEDAVVLLDRQQGGRRKLLDAGVRMHSIFTVAEVLAVLQSNGRISDAQVDSVKQFVKDNQF